MIDKTERVLAHEIDFGPDYLPNPHGHLNNQRDYFHFHKALEKAKVMKAEKILDVGCFDGWLDFLLMEKGFNLTGVELIPSLAAAAERYAKKNFLAYKVHQGFFEDIGFSVWDKFDLVMCLETLEHIDFEMVPTYLEKMESLSLKGIFISLPDQDHNDNIQHMWTPTAKLVKDLFGDKIDNCIEYHKYDAANIPPNWIISYEV